MYPVFLKRYATPLLITSKVFTLFQVLLFVKKEDEKTKGVCCKSFNFYVALLYKQRPLSDYSNHRKMPSRSRSRSRSIVAVRKNGKVTNFYKMVTTTTKAGKKTRVPRFLPRSKWPRSKSQLRALGVKESYSQIVKNNESSLRKGRAKRRSNTKKSRKSKSPRSSPKKSRSSKKRSSRKSRKSKKRSSSRGVSKSERSFRKKYYNKDSSVSGHSSHSVSSPIPTPPPRPSVSGKSSSKKYAAKFAGVDDKKVLDAIREEIDSVSGGSAQRRRNRRNRRSARKSRRSARKSRRSAKRSASRQRRSASRKSRRSARRSARKASRSASRSRRSLSRKSRRSARSASRKTRRGRKASVTGAKVSRSHKSRTGASASKKGAAWIKKKNTALKYLMRRDYGRVLSRAEFMDLPESVRTELQKQAYERAFPAVADRTPEHLLSHEGRAKRATRKEKERVAKSKSRSGRRIRKYVTSSP